MSTLQFQQTNQLDELKKKLRSRVRSIERLVDQLVDQQLLGPGEESKQKAIYISRILQKLREEIDMLERPAMIDARHAKAIKELQRIGCSEAIAFLQDSRTIIGQYRGLVKTAQQRSSMGNVDQAIQAVRTEINTLSYTRHLHNLYEILTFLDEQGRGSEADAVAKIIRDDLPSLESITKKLTDVFTALGRLPLES